MKCFPFCLFKQGNCHFLVKECAQVLVTGLRLPRIRVVRQTDWFGMTLIVLTGPFNSNPTQKNKNRCNKLNIRKLIFFSCAKITCMICDLAVAIIRDGKVPSDWEQSFIFCLYKGKGDALERGNYRGLKLTEQVMKILERIVDGLIRQLVSVDNSQFGFVPGRGTTDAIFVVRQLQEKYLAANKRLYMAFVDLEKAFDRVPRKVIWWALRKLGVEEWIVRLVQGMYANARSRVRVGEGYSEEFEVKVGVHQGSVVSPLLFIIVLEALS